jgi:hypothetical protein
MDDELLDKESADDTPVVEEVPNQKRKKGRGNAMTKIAHSLREIFNRFFVRIPYPAQPERGVSFPLPGLLTESGMS